MTLTVANRMTAGAVTVEEHVHPQQVVDLVEGGPAAGAAAGVAGVAGVAVVDAFGRLLGVIDPADHPDLFGHGAGARVAGTPRHRRRRSRRVQDVAADLMAPAVTVADAWPVARASRVLTDAGMDAAFVVDDLGCVRGTITTRQCRPAPAAPTALKEAGRDQVRV